MITEPGDQQSGLGRRVWSRCPRWGRTVVGGSGPPVASSSPHGKTPLASTGLLKGPVDV